MRDRPPALAIQQNPLPIPRVGAASVLHSERSRAPEDDSVTTFLPPWDTVEAYTRLFLKHCNYQPLPLFSEDLLSNLTSRDPELLLALSALASRFERMNYPGHRPAPSQTFDVYATPAKEMIMRRVAHGPVELSTIQTLCLLSLAEFNSRSLQRHMPLASLTILDGNTPQASMYSSLAADLVLSSGLSAEDPRTKQDAFQEERRRCYWSVVLLRNLYGGHAGTFSFVRDEKSPPVPQSPHPPTGLSSQMTDSALEQPEGHNTASGPSDLGVVAYVIELSGIWQRTARYAHRRGKAGGLAPWSSQSDYSEITAALMDSETRLPYKYRFRPARFADQDPVLLQENRVFWASWIFLQTLYHTVLCLLNHPLLLSLRLRNFRVTMVPEIFLQHTADLTATHTEWIVHLLDVCERKEFELHNPFLAHSAAIAATVYLQQSYSENIDVRSRKQECFRKCLLCIQRLSHYWPYLGQLALKIERFEQVVSASYRDPTSQQALDSRVFIDLNLFWDIIESSFINELPETARPYFGPSLTSHRQTIQSGEVLRTRLLPEPTRIGPDIDHRPNEAASAFDLLPPSSMPNPQNSEVDLLAPVDGEASILAQNYFALGEDFVGNLDDWWFPRQ
ncbi:hypothetical protein H2200_013384 [Cladophialophora chaetospira]|uniref:Xylanolytic transcriptional activator regulatory domain-containing protein n=1 Tax=Cladophialophora chaetospira TaxID=386627 RepID=A0AA38TZ17_9EURO|nr:hypothetical protein H2200_013384 [Cladophialophora chaetospira]